MVNHIHISRQALRYEIANKMGIINTKLGLTVLYNLHQMQQLRISRDRFVWLLKL